MSRAIVIDAYGGPEVLKIRDVAIGRPGPREIRVRHTLVGVNYHDVYVRSGLYKTLALPGTPGIEAVGVVAECGAEVSRWKVGDRVAYVSSAYGIYAEERLLDETLAHRIPDAVSDEAAASAILRGLTVDVLVNRVHRLQAGSWVLVQAAAGGVGQLLCQWASRIGARVIGTVSSDAAMDSVRAIGCEHPINYRREDVAARIREITAGQGVSVAYDAVGRDTFDTSLGALDFCGHLVNYGQASGPVPPFEIPRLAARSLSVSRPIVFHYLRTQAQRDAMYDSVFAALAAGWLTVKPPRIFPLADAAESHRAIENGGAAVPLLLRP